MPHSKLESLFFTETAEQFFSNAAISYVRPRQKFSGGVA